MRTIRAMLMSSAVRGGCGLWGGRLAGAVLVTFLLASVAAASQASAAVTNTFQITQLTDNGYTDMGAQVSGERIVWQGSDATDFEIFVWSVADGLTQMTDDGVNEDSPQVSGDRLVWAAGGGSALEIYTQKVGDPSSTRLTNNSYQDYLVQVSGDRVVWEGRDGSFREIFTWTPTGGTVQVTNSSAYDNAPKVSGDRVVWEVSDGTDSEIFTWTPTGGTVSVTNDSYDDMAPQVSGDRVVWERYDDTDWEIYTWTPGGGTVQITNNSVDDNTAQVSGDRVVWQRYDDTDWEIHTWTLGGGTVQITNNSVDDNTAQVSGDRVVWQRYAGEDSEICTWTPAGGAVQITNNSYADNEVAVSGDLLAWRGYLGGNWEIFTATPFDRYQETDSDITYLGAWANSGDTGWKASGNSYKCTSQVGSVAVAKFYGDQIRVIGKKCPWYGQAKITIDPGAPGQIVVNNVSFYSSNWAQDWKALIYESPALSYGGHSIVIECQSGSICLDTLDITGGLNPASVATKIDDKDADYFTYTPTWPRWDDSGYWAASNDTYTYTDQATYKATFTFNGCFASWITRTANTQGKAKVTLDPGIGEKVSYVDLYSPTTQWKKPVYSTGLLSPGDHTVVIECLGTKNPASWWKSIGVDRFDIIENK